MSGDHRNLPFLVDMAGLFELFVAEWLNRHLTPPLTVTAQQTAHLDPEHRLRFVVDMVLHDAPGGRPLAVLDTKYKDTATPPTGDIAQVVAYAERLGCTEAFLVYPTHLDRPVDLRVGRIRVRTVGFPLEGELDEAGEGFLLRVSLGRNR